MSNLQSTCPAEHFAKKIKNKNSVFFRILNNKFSVELSEMHSTHPGNTFSEHILSKSAQLSQPELANHSFTFYLLRE